MRTDQSAFLDIALAPSFVAPRVLSFSFRLELVPGLVSPNLSSLSIFVCSRVPIYSNVHLPSQVAAPRQYSSKPAMWNVVGYRPPDKRRRIDPTIV